MMNIIFGGLTILASIGFTYIKYVYNPILSDKIGKR